MLQALKNSPEKKELVDAAIKYLRGVKGTLVQQKKRDREKAMLAKGLPIPPPPPGNAVGRPPKNHNQNQNQNQNQSSRPNSGGQSVPPGGFLVGPPMANAQMNQSSVGGGGQDQRFFAQQHMGQQMQPPKWDDQHVENALRGFLGNGG
jgi:hypothetical protein